MKCKRNAGHQLWNCLHCERIKCDTLNANHNQLPYFLIWMYIYIYIYICAQCPFLPHLKHQAEMALQMFHPCLSPQRPHGCREKRSRTGCIHSGLRGKKSMDCGMFVVLRRYWDPTTTKYMYVYM